MKTRFSILSALFCLFALSSWADTTTDHFTIEELSLNPGKGTGEEYISISLEGDNYYTAYGFDLYLPEGYEFNPYTAGDWDSALDNAPATYDIYPYSSSRSGKTYSHTITCNLQKDGSLRITAYSSSNAEFLSTKGEIVRVYVKATSYAKPGFADVQIKNAFLTVATGAVQYNVTAETISDKVSATTDASVPVSVSADNKWSTFVSPFEVEKIPDGLKVYKYVSLDKANEVVNVKQQSKIEAYTPYILYSESGYTGTLTGTIDADSYKVTVTDGLLVGVIEKQSVSAGYVLQNLTEGVKFYTMASAFTIPAGKCYLLPSDASSKLSIAFEDETDGINDINANANDDVYDLQGRKLQNPQQRGIYIVNGKKVVKK